VIGAMSVTGTGAANQQGNTNVLGLIDNNWVQNVAVDRSISNTTLGSYVGMSPGIFKCPADKSSDRSSRKDRVRSVSMNQVVGWNTGGNWINRNNTFNTLGGAPFLYRREADITKPTPAGLFVLVDEHPDSLNDGGFGTFFAIPSRPDLFAMVDFPANYHNNASSFSFADGHAEIRKWTDPRTILRITYSQSVGTSMTALGYPPGPLYGMPGNMDCLWLGQVSSGQ